MFPSLLIYVGLAVVACGTALVLRRRTRARGVIAAVAGVGIAAIGLLLPARELRSERTESRLDEVMPRWQFHEVHRRHVAAPPDRVFAAVHQVRADEIAFFRTLTWIRRGGRDLPEGILNAGDRPLLDIATRNGFLYLAYDPPRELVVGTAVIHPAGAPNPPPADLFTSAIPSGYALAAMNFVVTADGAGGSVISTETRVYASDPRSRSSFRKYWRLIYPGSAIIRRMWLRAIERRATA